MDKSFKLAAFIAAFTLVTITSCKKEDDLSNGPQNNTETPDFTESGTNPDETDLANSNERIRLQGYLYTVGNEAGTNQIHSYRQNVDGSLTYLGATASGGAGSNMALGSQGALALSHNNRWLFAVNAGDNSVSAFRVHSDGSLTLTDTESSDGTNPVSVAVRGRYVYVVNAGSADINGYELDQNGGLTEIPGTNLPLSDPGAAPAQIAFSPNGDHLYVTEKMTNMITSFDVNANGVAVAGSSIASTGVTPFGFSIARNRFMVVSNAGMGMPGASTVTSYQGVNSGNLQPANGAVPNNQSAACWVGLTKHERFAYITNTGSDNISTYYVAPWGSIYLVHAATVVTDDAPIDICVAPNNYYVYNINSMSQTITGFRRAPLGDLIGIGSTSGLPAFAAGLVAW